MMSKLQNCKHEMGFPIGCNVDIVVIGWKILNGVGGNS